MTWSWWSLTERTHLPPSTAELACPSQSTMIAHPIWPSSIPQVSPSMRRSHSLANLNDCSYPPTLTPHQQYAPDSCCRHRALFVLPNPGVEAASNTLRWLLLLVQAHIYVLLSCTLLAVCATTMHCMFFSAASAASLPTPFSWVTQLMLVQQAVGHRGHVFAYVVFHCLGVLSQPM
jgi:hypothetical protein